MKALQIKVAGEIVTRNNGSPLDFDVRYPKTAEKAGDIFATMNEFSSDKHGDIELVLVNEVEEDIIAVRRWNEEKGTYDEWYRSTPYRYRLERGLPL